VSGYSVYICFGWLFVLVFTFQGYRVGFISSPRMFWGVVGWAFDVLCLCLKVVRVEGYWCYIILLYIDILLYYYILLYIYCYIIHILLYIFQTHLSPPNLSSSSIPSLLPHLSYIPLLIYLSPILPHSRNTSRYLDRIINISSVLSKTLRTILTPHVLSWWKVLSVWGVYLCWDPVGVLDGYWWGVMMSVGVFDVLSVWRLCGCWCVIVLLLYTILLLYYYILYTILFLLIYLSIPSFPHSFYTCRYLPTLIYILSSSVHSQQFSPRMFYRRRMVEVWC